MENIIIWLENYWGVTIVGGVTFGTIISFVVVQVMTLSKGKVKDKQILTAMDTVNLLVDKLNAEQASKKVMTEEQAAKDAFTQQVIATMFKSITYLAMASKLPVEEKIALKEGFDAVLAEGAKIMNGEFKQLVDSIKATVVAEVPTAVEIIKQTADGVDSLLEQYTKVEGK